MAQLSQRKYPLLCEFADGLCATRALLKWSYGALGEAWFTEGVGGSWRNRPEPSPTPQYSPFTKPLCIFMLPACTDDSLGDPVAVQALRVIHVGTHMTK